MPDSSVYQFLEVAMDGRKNGWSCGYQKGFGGERIRKAGDSYVGLVWWNSHGMTWAIANGSKDRSRPTLA